MERVDVYVSPGTDRAALSYTLELFRECTGARPGCELHVSEASPPLSPNPAIYYGCPVPDEARGFLEIPLRTPRDFGGTRELQLDGEIGEAAGGPLLVYEEALADSEPPARVDRERKSVRFGFDPLATAFAFAACLEERAHESREGPVHGYAARLTRDPRRFARPWAEVHFAVLARALVLAAGRDDLFEPRGQSSLHLGHDVDAADKRFLKSAKQAVFDVVNAGRACLSGRGGQAARRAARALGLPFSGADYFQFDAIRAMEERAGLRSTFYVYAGGARRGIRGRLRRAVFDPDYDVRRHTRLRGKLRELLAAGWSVGLHASFDAFEDAALLAEEKRTLEAAIDAEVTRVRNHWLRFSLGSTWRAQAEAGFTEDATLGFNDALGFRAGLARPFAPFDPEKKAALPVTAVPVVAMDATLFDYMLFSAEEAGERCLSVLAEAERVASCAGISWHVHGFSDILGWGKVYERLLSSRTEEAAVG